MSWIKLIGWTVSGLALLIIGGAAWMLGPALLPAKAADVGIAQGAKAPITMELRDSQGKPTSLAAQMGPNGLVLYLVRSADWCPFCKAQLKDAKAITPTLQTQGYGVASLSYDKPAVLMQFAAEHDIRMALLSDEQSRMIDALGLRDPQYAADHFAAGVPLASTLVLGPDGTVTARFVAEDYRSRISNDEVLEMVRKATK